MDTKELEKQYPRKSAAWKLCVKWAQFAGAQRAKLDGYASHVYNKRVASSLVYNVIAYINKGELANYKAYLLRHYPHEVTKELLAGYWDQFCEMEKVLVAEVLLAG
jgi:hypothetical protein